MFNRLGVTSSSDTQTDMSQLWQVLNETRLCGMVYLASYSQQLVWITLISYNVMQLYTAAISIEATMVLPYN